MKATREQVFSALFAKLQNVPGLVTVSRTVVSVQDMQPEQMPAAFQLQGKQSIVYKGSVPAYADMEVQWLFYVAHSDPTVAPSTVLNGILDAACASLAPSGPADKQSLGGLVEYAAVSGDIEIFEGVLGETAIAVVPIKIIFAGF